MLGHDDEQPGQVRFDGVVGLSEGQWASGFWDIFRGCRGMDDTASGQSTAAAQGDLALLDTELAQQLLASTIPALFAYTATDGSPRVLPTWFH